MQFRCLLYVVVIISTIVPTTGNCSDKYDYLCQVKAYQEYKRIEYWGSLFLSVVDYSFHSDDAITLGLATKINKISEKPNAILLEHFRSEFFRLLKGKLPFYDIHHMAFFSECYKKTNDYNKTKACIESNVRAKFGPNPGSMGIWIKVKRTEFPILYEITCKLSKSKMLAWRDFECITERDLGFGDPDTIIDELKVAITEILKKVSKTYWHIHSCPDSGYKY
jgi:hypothetical protein